MAFAALVPDEVRSVLGERGVSLSLVCERLGVDRGRWEEVCASPKLTAARQQAHELTPPAAVLDQASQMERFGLRQPARDALLEGYLAAAPA
jgi:hypothetical protein